MMDGWMNGLIEFLDLLVFVLPMMLFIVVG